ncbi:hypothetical protein EDB86DRAFT_2967250 [Lactarius hatsudake]|nr:hypothetical protein EDB86DRAFT_2967250 [Lactarius hatsudake]
MGKPMNPPKARRVTKATGTAKPGETSTDRANQRRTAIHAAGPPPIPAKSYDAAREKALGARQARTTIAQSTPKHLTEEILAAERPTAARVAEQSVPGIMKPQRITADMLAWAAHRLAAIDAENLNKVIRVRVEGDNWEMDYDDATEELFAIRLRESRFLHRVLKEDSSVLKETYPPRAKSKAPLSPAMRSAVSAGTAYHSPPLDSASLARCPTST